jgi:sigma-B regulation protein RsbU (phosphoserine phosphatase)
MSPLLSESQLLKERLKEPPWYRLVEPRRVVERLNSLFQTTSEMSQYFTMVYGLVHLESGRTRWVTAGHPGPVHAPRNAAPVHLSCRSHPVGLLEHPRFEDREVVLEPGDRIWFYSDGVTDATDHSERELGSEGLERLVTDLGGRPLRSAVDRVMVEVERWSQPGEPADDCTLLALERSTVPAKPTAGPTARMAAVGAGKA